MRTLWLLKKECTKVRQKTAFKLALDSMHWLLSGTGEGNVWVVCIKQYTFRLHINYFTIITFSQLVMRNRKVYNKNFNEIKTVTGNWSNKWDIRLNS